MGVCAMRVSVALLLANLVLASATHAQELNPRAYWPLPKDSNVLVFGYQNSSGDVVTDPSLPLTGVDSDIDYLTVAYQRNLSLFGRSANLQLNLPYSEGRTEGFVEGEFRRRDTAGFGDARVRLSINLRGAPSMDRAQLRELLQNPKTIVGASLLVQAPTGEYDPDRFINIGTNRWSVKPAIGLIWPIRSGWLFEAEIGAWLFSDNDEFVGQTREQDPIVSTELHIIKLITPRVWASLDGNYYVGGETTIDGNKRADLQRNARMGVTLYAALKGGHAVRSGYSTGVVTESGGDYEIFNISYVYAW
jgi:hypothetical protein